MRPVEVLADDGRWRRGPLERWRRDDRRGWIGYVWWHRDVGLPHVEWITGERLRPLTDAT